MTVNDKQIFRQYKKFDSDIFVEFLQDTTKKLVKIIIIVLVHHNIGPKQ